MQYKYATIGLAVALFLVTVFPWVWSAIGEIFVDVDEANMSGRDHPEVPESWTSHRWEPSGRIEAMYLAYYDDCTLQINKSGTGAGDVSVLSLLECSQEDGRTFTSYDPDGDVKFETVPSDFEAAWTDRVHCSMQSWYETLSDEHANITLLLSCGN